MTIKGKYRFPSTDMVGGSGNSTYPAKAMIMCFETLGLILSDLTDEVKRLADAQENANKHKDNG